MPDDAPTRHSSIPPRPEDRSLNIGELHVHAPDSSLSVDGTEQGVIRRGGMVIGSFDAAGLVLDLGWCRMAGVSVRLLDDRLKGDNHRGGVAFERDVVEG